jgi:hypothetical protein
MGSESAAERRQSYQRKHAASESSAIPGSESSRKSYFAVNNTMTTHFKIQRLLSATIASVLLCCVAMSALAQQTNPNNLPPCPKPDYSKNTDGERFAKWTNCWGRYQLELDKTKKGNVYEGEWRNGLPNGHGAYTYADGHKYVGESKDGKSHGQGTFTFANGDKYVGDFKEDKYHGQGIGITADGKRFEGIWENGNFIREAKIKLPGQNVQSTRTTQDSNISDTSANSFGVEDAKVKCQELGFKTGTERYGKCVLELSR